MNNHKNKHIRASVDYALERGWQLETAGGHAHVWGYLLCPAARRGGCRVPVYSTPRVPENHARFIRRKVDACSH
jgi:hypothetical protein